MQSGVGASLAALSAVLFFTLLQSLPEGDASLLEYRILNELNDWRTPSLDMLFRFVTWLGSFYVLGPLVALTAVALFIAGSKWRGYYLCSVFYGSSLTTFLLKRLIERDRPDPGNSIIVMLPDDPSFPSGHSTQALAFALSVAIMIWHKGVGMKLCVGSLLLVAFAVAFSRLYLQVHWPSDIVAGGFVALFWAAIAAVFYRTK